MKHFLQLSIALLFTLQLTAQTQEINQYSYVLVPDKFDIVFFILLSSLQLFPQDLDRDRSRQKFGL